MKRLLLFALAIALSSCATMMGLKAPDVTVADVQSLGGTLLEQRFRLSLRVTNPNEKEIALEGVSFRMEVNGQRFATGVGATPVVVPRLGDTLVALEGSAQLLSLLRQIPRLAQGNAKLAYRLRGEVITRDYGRLPFDHEGEFDPAGLIGEMSKQPADAL